MCKLMAPIFDESRQGTVVITISAISIGISLALTGNRSFEAEADDGAGIGDRVVTGSESGASSHRGIL